MDAISQAIKSWVSGWAKTTFFSKTSYLKRSNGTASGGQPFVVDANGKIDKSFFGTIWGGITSLTRTIPLGTDTKAYLETLATDAIVQLWQDTNDALGPVLALGKSRGTAAQSNTVVQNGDVLGEIDFWGADGGSTTASLGASIVASVNATPGNNDMPTKLDFKVSPDGSATPATKLTIDSTGLASPTIVTPTIASFTNATHNHSNAAGGGNLPASSIVPTDTATSTFGGTIGYILSLILEIAATTTATLRLHNTGAGGNDWKIATAATGSAPAGAVAGDLYFNDATTGQVTTLSGTGILTTAGINLGNTNLTNYTEGTWTPVLRFGAASVGITYTTQTAEYTRIGRLVVCRLTITLSSKGSSVGNADISGLPFTVNAAGSWSSAPRWAAMATSYVSMTVVPISGATTATIFGITAAAVSSSGNVADTNFNNNSTITGSFMYFV